MTISVGKQIREARRKRNLSLAKLAEKTNITPNHLGKIERGEVKPSYHTISVLCIVLQFNPLDSLLRKEKKRMK
ncbi:helix-turn-helix domain-containing protein [Niallia sp. 03133]|uniref:helix-turn-helix domain-containing protein n=1 Tax=Niallia sp. 03133 TaxID=3458060 RepID=UPI004044DC41